MKISKNFENGGSINVTVESEKFLIGIGADSGAYSVATVNIQELDEAILSLKIAKDIMIHNQDGKSIKLFHQGNLISQTKIEEK